MQSVRPGGESTNDAIEAALKRLVERYGLGLLRESQRLKSLLQDECPQARREISVLLQALDENVPQDLMRVHSGEPVQALAPRLAKRLAEEKMIAPEASRWAVRVWARGLGVDAIEGVDQALDASPPSVIVNDMRDGNVVPFPNEGIGAAAAAGAANAANAGTNAAAGAAANGVAGAAAHIAANSNPGFVPAGDAGQSQAGSAAEGTHAPKPMSRLYIAGAAIALATAAGVWLAFFQPEMRIMGVTMREPFVADGKPREVTVDFAARNTDVRAVEVHFLHGEGRWSAEPWDIPVPAAAAAQGHASAGTLWYRSTQAGTATFSYVLVSADGKRSTPYEQTFEIAAAPKPAIGCPCGTILSIKEIDQEGEGTGVGAALGGVVGAVAGHQGGKGRGKDVATALGAVAGAVAGHFAEKKIRSQTTYEITVRMDDGSTQVIKQASATHLHSGEHVRVANGVVAPFGS